MKFKSELFKAILIGFDTIMLLILVANIILFGLDSERIIVLMLSIVFVTIVCFSLYLILKHKIKSEEYDESAYDDE